MSKQARPPPVEGGPRRPSDRAGQRVIRRPGPNESYRLDPVRRNKEFNLLIHGMKPHPMFNFVASICRWHSDRPLLLASQRQRRLLFYRSTSDTPPRLNHP